MDATCTIQDSIHVFNLVHKYVSRILGTYHVCRGFLFCTLCVRLRRLHLLRLVILDALRVDGNGLDTLVFKRAVHVVGWNICNLIHDIQTIHDLAESSIASVEMRTILVHDEKLRTGGVRHHGTCHRKNTRFVLQIICKSVLRELAAD